MAREEETTAESGGSDGPPPAVVGRLELDPGLREGSLPVETL